MKDQKEPELVDMVDANTGEKYKVSASIAHKIVKGEVTNPFNLKLEKK